MTKTLELNSFRLACNSQVLYLQSAFADVPVNGIKKQGLLQDCAKVEVV